MFSLWINNKEKLKDTLKLLSDSTLPLWGRLDAQQMIEHLIALFELSNKEQETPILTPEKYLHKSVDFLMSNELMPKNFVAKFLPIDPPPYIHASLDEAVFYLFKVLDSYHIYWVGKEACKLNHPIFGSLTKDKWDRVHNKHIHHHFLQFGLIK